MTEPEDNKEDNKEENKEDNKEENKEENSSVQQFSEDENEEPFITHVIITKSGDTFFAYRSLELEEQLPNGDVGILVVIDAIGYPEKGDRSIITISKDNVDFTHEYFDDEVWDHLMEAAYCAHCINMSRGDVEGGLYG